MTSLFIAIKISEPVELDAASMSMLSRGLQTAEDITECKRDILATLKWRLLLPESAGSFASKLRKESFQRVKRATEDYDCVPLRRSSLALADVLNSLETVSKDDFRPTTEMGTCVFYPMNLAAKSALR